MMTGIMAIFEMGLSLTGQSLLPTPLDVYVLAPTKAKALDQNLLELLADPAIVSWGLDGEDLCLAINNAYSGSSPFGYKSISKGRWSDGCLLNSDFDGISHRVLIQSPGSGRNLLPYKLFSCTSKRNGYQCSFERE